jgi:hypothetical protein
MSRTFFPGEFGAVGPREPYPGQEQLTPWRTSFGGYSHPDFANKGRSGLRPMLPEHQSPLGLVWEPDRDQSGNVIPIPKPDYKSLDDLFLSERFQTQSCAGLKSCQLAAINRGVFDEYSRITVNENDWHAVFQKKQWFDYRLPEEGEDSVPRWSVDNEAFWEEMKIPLEMANRIFNVLTRTKW